MARCEEGYLCEVCGADVESITDSDLYLRFVIGLVDPESLHTSRERHIRRNPMLAQFIVDDKFPALLVEGDFDKRKLDPHFVRQREELVTSGWRRLHEVAGSGLSILEYALDKRAREAGDAMDMRIHEFDLPLRHVFTISRGSITVQKTLIVELVEDGFHGYGEATTNDYYGFTFENMSGALERVRPLVESWKLEDPAGLWEACARSIGDNPFALCALDQAAYDLWGKQRAQPVYKLWGLNLDSIPPSDYTIGIDRIERMVEKLQEFPGWPIYKIKLGTSQDLEIVRSLRPHTSAVFRVDANCGWSADEALSNSGPLQELGVEFIEQPLPADRWVDVRVHDGTKLPVVADESCIVESDVDRCAGYFQGVNIKLVKCGGLTPARRMIARARQLGLKVMVGCMTESTVGISAIAQLLPLLDYVDMDGAVLLARDIATGVTLDKGVCRYPPVNGNGVTLIAPS